MVGGEFPILYPRNGSKHGASYQGITSVSPQSLGGSTNHHLYSIQPELKRSRNCALERVPVRTPTKTCATYCTLVKSTFRPIRIEAIVWAQISHLIHDESTLPFLQSINMSAPVPACSAPPPAPHAGLPSPHQR